MWTQINQVYTTHNSQNCWAHFAATGKWHKVVTGAVDGVTNMFVLLCAAKANGKQVYAVLDAAGNLSALYL